jgi:hypothetical protein
MIEKAKTGYYDDYDSPLVFPITELVSDLMRAGFPKLARRAANGDFDAKGETPPWRTKRGHRRGRND